MKYQTGDDIIILHTKEEGKVIEILNTNMLLVEVRGVRFPVYTDQLDFPYYQRFTNKKETTSKKPVKKFIDDVPKQKNATIVNKEEGVLLSLIPKFTLDNFNDEVVVLFKLYLINNNKSGYHFNYKQLFFGEEAFEIKGEILSRKDFYLHDISFDDFNDNPSFIFEFSLVSPDKLKADYNRANIKLKPKQLFQRIEKMKQKNEPSITFKLFHEYPPKQQEEKFEVSENIHTKYALYQAEKIRENLEPARSVIDLHAEKLTDNWKRMDNFEILSLQLKEFEHWYDLAVAHYQPTLTVIHGIGTGKLRDEIHDILKTKREVKTFINQYHSRYGYGATEIYFHY